MPSPTPGPATAARDRLLEEAVATFHARQDHVAVVQLVEAWAAHGAPTYRARLLQGGAFHALRLLDRAMTRAQEALDADPADPAALRLLAQVYLDRGWPVKARRPLAALMELGEDVAAQWRRAHEEPARPEANAREIERDGDIVRLLALAEAFLAAGSFLRATGLLERVRRAQPENARARALLWGIAGEFGGADVDALLRRAQGLAAASAVDAASDESEHTETLGVDPREAIEEADARFPTLFKAAGAASGPAPEAEAAEVTQTSAHFPSSAHPADGGDAPRGERLTGSAGSGDTQILLVIRPGEGAAASASRAAHRRRPDADAEAGTPVDLRAWQRSMGVQPGSDLDDVPDDKLEEEDIDRVVVTRHESALPAAADPSPSGPIEVMERHPSPLTPALASVPPPTALVDPARGEAASELSRPGAADPSPAREAAPEGGRAAAPPTGSARAGRSPLLAGLAFFVLIAVGLAVLVFGVRGQRSSEAMSGVGGALATEDYAALLAEEGRLERIAAAEGEASVAEALATVRLALWSDHNGDPARLDAVDALVARPEGPLAPHAFAVLRAASALASDDAAGAAAALGREQPDNDEERLLFARVSARGGDAERAVAHLDAIEAANAIRYRLGRVGVLVELGRLAEARSLVEEIHRVNPAHVAARVARLELLEAPADVAAEATDLLAHARDARGGGSPVPPRLEGRIHAAYARALAALGAPDAEVRAMISSGLAHDGTNPVLLYMLAADDARAGRLTAALADLDLVLQRRHGHAAARTAAILVLLDLDRVDAAVERFEGYPADAAGTASGAAARALVAAQGTGEPVDAAALPDTAVARWAAALAATQSHAPDAGERAAQAVDALTRSADPFEQRLLPRARALRALIGTEAPVDGRAPEALAAGADDPYVHVLVARAHEAAGQRARAALHFDRAAELGAELGLAWYEKGRFYMDAGDNFARTGAAWRTYLGLAPTGPRATRAKDTLAVR